jgi:hypothetical protein
MDITFSMDTENLYDMSYDNDNHPIFTRYDNNLEEGNEGSIIYYAEDKHNDRNNL